MQNLKKIFLVPFLMTLLLFACQKHKMPPLSTLLRTGSAIVTIIIYSSYNLNKYISVQNYF